MYFFIERSRPICRTLGIREYIITILHCMYIVLRMPLLGATDDNFISRALFEVYWGTNGITEALYGGYRGAIFITGVPFEVNWGANCITKAPFGSYCSDNCIQYY